MALKEAERDRGIKVALIIVNFNGGDSLRRCLEAVKRQTLKPDRCLLVDNASLYEPINGDEAWLQGVELLRSKNNLGFAAANNLAVKACEDMDWVAFLNPDAYPEPDWLLQLMKAISAHPEMTSFASRQLMAEDPERLDGAGDALSIAGRPFRRGFGLPEKAHFTQKDEVFSACGAAMLVKREVFLSLGGFDEDFFCYLEDIDLGFRLRLMGHRCLFIPKAIVHHEGSLITGKQGDFSTYHGHRNLFWVYLKNMPGILFWLYLPLHLAISLGSIIHCGRRGQGRILIKAKWDALKQLGLMLKKRRAIQAQRKATTLAIQRFLIFRLF